MTTEGREHLWSSISERDQLLREAKVAVRRAATLAQALDCVHNAPDLDKGIEDALTLFYDATGSNTWFLLAAKEDGTADVLASNDAALHGRHCHKPCPLMSGPMRVGALREMDWANALPPEFLRYSSLLSTSVAVPFQPALSIGVLSLAQAAYSDDDLVVLRRIGDALSQSLVNRQLVRRNAASNRAVSAAASEVPTESQCLDPSFETVQQYFGHFENWQAQIIEITNDVLSAPTTDIDGAIERALRRMGALATADRAYIFRVRDGDRMDNTHEWVAPGIEPMITQLQDLPTDLLDESTPELRAGQPVHIPDVGALPAGSAPRKLLEIQQIRSLLLSPMLRNGVLTGYVGFDAVRSPRNYLPAEIQLLQSVSNAIATVFDRTEAENRAELAHQSLLATLRSVPDLIFELDRDGRFVGQFGGPSLPASFPDEVVVGRRPEEILPLKVAGLAYRMMHLINTHGQCDAHEYQLDIKGETRTFVASGSAKVMNGKQVGYVLATRDITTRAKERRMRRL